jgi:ABC-type nitrate/sulfonate/bicarbonate transport system permease component
VGTFFGIIVAAIISASKLFEAVLEPVIEIVRPVPPIALTPFFILWFGLGDFGQLFLISLGCFMVVAVNALVAIRNVPIVYLYAARSLGANKFNLYKTVYLPAVSPSILAGMRVGAATGFGLTVAAEYLGAQGGLGFLIRNARTILDTSSILIAVIILGVQSLLTDASIRLLFSKITKWVPND